MRLFVAIELDEATKAAVASAADRLRTALGAGARHFRFTPAANLHLTLRFLGETDERLLPGLTQSLASAIGSLEPFALGITGAGGFPNPSHARVLWLGLGEGRDRVVDLATRVESAVVAVGFAPEKRAFSPHLTIARTRDRPRRIDRAAESIADVARTTVREVTLVRSVLGATAAYTPLATFPSIAITHAETGGVEPG